MDEFTNQKMNTRKQIDHLLMKIKDKKMPPEL